MTEWTYKQVDKIIPIEYVTLGVIWTMLVIYILIEIKSEDERKEME